MKPPSTPSFNPGDRITPKDSKSLWSDPHCALVVKQCYPCRVTGSIEVETIQVEVTWRGKNSFLTVQPADAYDRVSTRYTLN